MDLMYMIVTWLKKFIERMISITSFIGESFLPDNDSDDSDFDILKPRGLTGKK